MRNRQLLPILAGVVLTLAACDGPGTPYRKQGADADQTRRDYDDCRGRVNAYLAKDRGIDDDRRASIPGAGSPVGPSGIRQEMDSGTNSRRTGRLMNDCMGGKGYSGGEAQVPGIRW